MQENSNLNLCTEIVVAMRLINIDERIINSLSNTMQFIHAMDKQPTMQRVLITSSIYRLLISIPNVPSEIRLSLNIAPTVYGWMDDMKLVILPFIKANEVLYVQSCQS